MSLTKPQECNARQKIQFHSTLDETGVPANRLHFKRRAIEKEKGGRVLNVTERRNDIKFINLRVEKYQRRSKAQIGCRHMDKMIDVFVLTQLMKRREKVANE